MLEAVGQYGPGLKKPSPYQLGTPLLENRVRSLDEYANAHKEAWALTGCSILTDAWTDRRGRSLMNLVAHSARGVWFLRAEDASADVHDAKYIYSFVHSCINEIGPEKVVQVVTDNASNNMAAAKLLKQKYPQIFWTPCAAHTIDLMLEDIGKKPTVQNTIKKAKSITTYIYAHTRVLSIMRSFTGDHDLVRAGTTRFATCYLNLKSLYDKRKELKEMFGSTKWTDSRYSKQKAGNDVAKLVAGNDFWSSILRLINYFEPLAFVLRRVDGDVPAMGYLYGDLQNAKKEIVVRFNGNAKKYSFVCDIIDARWNDKLKTPLHKAGYYLNPFFYYESKTEMEEEVFVAAVIQCASRIFHDDDKVQDMIVAQLNMYTNGTDSFGTPMAIRQRKSTTITPASWWAAHGTAAKELRKLAIKILNLTCSSSACERNWSAFERVHSKKRTRLTQKRLNSLVYVMFNKRLQWKYSQRNRDPLAIKFVDDEPANDWLEEEVSVEGLQQANDTEEQDGESDCDVEQDEQSQGGENEKKRAPTTCSPRRSKRARNMEPEEEFSDEEEEDDTAIPLVDDSSSDDGENDADLHDEE